MKRLNFISKSHFRHGAGACAAAVVLAACSSGSGGIPVPGFGGGNGAVHSDPYLDSNHRFVATRVLPQSAAITEHGYSGYYTRFLVSAVNSLGADLPSFDNETLGSQAASSRDEAANRCRTPPVPADCYGTGGNAAPRDYSDETRNWLERLVVGRLTTKTAQLHINVSAPNVTSSSTLAAFTHESTRETGEQFETEIRHHSVATPLFRIHPDATVDLRLEFNVGYDVSSETIGAVLSTATTAISLLGPKSTLLTELNREEVNNAASFIDSTLSSVMDEDLTERLHSRHGIEDWLEGQIAVFSIQLPKHDVRRINDIDQYESVNVGEWRVELDLPRISVWSDYSPCYRVERRMVCPAIYEYGDRTPGARHTLEYRADDLRGSLAYLTPSETLQFLLSDDVTLGAYLRDREWFTDAVSRMNSGAPNARASFCRLVMRAATDVGLNSIDAHVALWAILGTAAVNIDARDAALAEDGECRQEGALMRRLALRGM